ncbi:hypothetical protein FVE85_5279 [Porphyridium purpureum]|uniref:Uncharacterized protein n=1 Tax=Porphyridium purpureum TaxID=35688 RepID=A0A5J4Z442_PORPP|nr:hypothetical protein FVE85_5279 [Porphyridium purpureum]|eukprot:POR5682..scf295_1
MVGRNGDVGVAFVAQTPHFRICTKQSGSTVLAAHGQIGGEAVSPFLLSRRAVLSLPWAALGTKVNCPQPVVASNVADQVESVFQLLQATSPQMLQAVFESKSLAYRGELESVDAPSLVMRPGFDLQDKSVYGEEGARYFLHMENYFKTISHARISPRPSAPTLLPSASHILVADRSEAGHWGTARSTWPVGHFEYMWFQDRKLLYEPQDPVHDCAQTIRRIQSLRPVFSERLDEALSLKREVMFASQSYISVASSMDQDLLNRILASRPAR